MKLCLVPHEETGTAREEGTRRKGAGGRGEEGGEMRWGRRRPNVRQKRGEKGNRRGCGASRVGMIKGGRRQRSGGDEGG